MVLLNVDVVKVLDDGDLQTLGLLDYDKRLTHSFPAHPKVSACATHVFESKKYLWHAVTFVLWIAKLES